MSLRISWVVRGILLAIMLAGLLFFAGRFFKLDIGIEKYVASALAAVLVSLWWSPQIRSWFDRIDWRLGAVLVATGISIAGTCAFLALGLGTDPQTFFGAVFAAWIGGVAFFALVGTVVTIVSLARPEEDSPEARARILLRGKSGPHITYIINRLSEIFEHYSENVANKVTVQDFDGREGKFLLAIEGTTTLRSYIDDIATTYDSHFELEGITTPPPGKENRVIKVNVGGNPIPGLPTVVRDKFYCPIKSIIPVNGKCEILQRIEIWVEAEKEQNTYSPVRYTQKILLEFENLLTQRISIEVYSEGALHEQFTLLPGHTKKLTEFVEIKPKQEVYDFRIRTT